MHVYYLISPVTTSPGFDPGCTFIRWGLRYLINQADPEAVFLPFSDVIYDKSDWRLLFDQADCVVLAGIPLYLLGDTHCYWDWEIWDHIKEVISLKIPVADLYGYTNFPLPKIDTKAMSQKIISHKRTDRTLEIQSSFSLIITRDNCSQIVASTIHDDVKALPCSGFWAARYVNVRPKTKKFNCVTIRHMPGHEWLLKSLHILSQTILSDKKCYFLCHTKSEYWWAKEHLPDSASLICIFDPISLLNFYAECEKVISIRLHGSVTALSLDCSIINLSTDLRSEALSLFGLESTPFTDLKTDLSPLNFRSLPGDPDKSIDMFVKKFREKIVSTLN